MSQDLFNQIASIISNHQKEALITPFDFDQNRKNELLFFFKPECFIDKTEADFSALVRMTLDRFAHHQVEVAGGLVLNGTRLDELSIMDRHYGFINTLSRRASTLLSRDEADFIQRNLSVDLGKVAVLGGHEFLSRYPAYNPDTLNDLWLSKKSIKVRSGFYIQSYAVDGSQVVLVNGFHPSQLAHFTHPSHQIGLLLLESDTPWKSLKDELAGDTYPERANPTSIRGELFKNRSLYHAENIAISNNYIHLSAGPFEALFEINNFLGRLGDIRFDLQQTNLARRMLGYGLAAKDAEQALSNPGGTLEGKPTDLFSATENMDTPPAIERFIQLVKPSDH